MNESMKERKKERKEERKIERKEERKIESKKERKMKKKERERERERRISRVRHLTGIKSFLFLTIVFCLSVCHRLNLYKVSISGCSVYLSESTVVHCRDRDLPSTNPQIFPSLVTNIRGIAKNL